MIHACSTDLDISQPAISLLSKMLQFDPDLRPSVAEALAHPFMARYHDDSPLPVCQPFNFDVEVRR